MKTIEERAREFCEKISVGQNVPNYIVNFMIECYRAGADSEHSLLSEWHDPKEHPQDGKTVIAKYTDKQYILAHYDHKWEEWVNELNDKFVVIIGWREIHK